uniref:Uncharacterized protein n=1 Tax=Anguilla anguilla TaxID=7936 RepID=A0A0E9W7I3_ANGAN
MIIIIIIMFLMPCPFSPLFCSVLCRYETKTSGLWREML